MKQNRKIPIGKRIKYQKKNQALLNKIKINDINKYNREPWMMKANPCFDKGEEIIRREIEEF